MNPLTPAKPILRVELASVHYGIIPALSQVSLEVESGKILAVLGSNGAGKTTTLRAISGLVPLSSGKIFLEDQEISHLRPHQIVRQRIYHVPEGRGIFLNLSVEENLDLGAWAAFQPKSYRDDLDRVFQLFPKLAERRKQNAGTLSGGEQQMLALGRALMGQPRILLLDEPSLGLAPQMIEKIFELIQEIHHQGVTVLLVEQNALQALQIADHAIVLETGKVMTQGEAKTLARSDAIKKAYLGEYLV
jgi:branched-chain amino acid transport system ATP-binding protein